MWEVGQMGRPPGLGQVEGLQVAIKVACHPTDEDLWARCTESIGKVVIVASAVLGRSGLSVRGSC